jgi:hypothetical protein
LSLRNVVLISTLAVLIPESLGGKIKRIYQSIEKEGHNTIVFRPLSTLMLILTLMDCKKQEFMGEIVKKTRYSLYVLDRKR